MEHQEHEEIYLSLSRKELQGLCKQHGLPANRSNIDLARALESLFRRTNFCASQLEEAFDVPSFTEPKPKDQLKFNKEIDKGFGREYITRKNSSQAGAYRRIACMRDSVGTDKRNSQTANQLENDNQVIQQVFNKDLDRLANVVSACPSSNATIDDAGCSTSGPGASSLQHLFATVVQDTATCHPFGLQCHQKLNQDEGNEISDRKSKSNSVQIPVVTRRKMCSLPLGASRINNFGNCFPGNGSFPHHVTSRTVPPAFQFFVESEDGIKLFINLSSTPSDWVKSLKDEVFISQELYNRKSMALRHEIQCLGDGNKNLAKPSDEIIGAGLQPKGSVGSVNSSLSFASEICDAVTQPTNVDTPRSLAVTSNRPLDLPSAHMDGVSQVLSSACTSNADMNNIKMCDALPRDMETLPPKSAANAFSLERANTSPHDGSPDKYFCNSLSKLQADHADHGQKLDQLEQQALETASLCSQHAEEGCLGHTSESAFGKKSFSLSSERCVMSSSFDLHSHVKHSRCCQLPLVTSSTELKLSDIDVAEHEKDKSTVYPPTQQILDSQLNNAELYGALTNHILAKHACLNAENPVLKAEASISNTELETCNSSKEKKSESSHYCKLSINSCKRSHISDLQEDFQNKRPHANGESPISVAMNLRSTKSYLKESNPDSVVLPRRSMRLMSK